MAFCKNCGQVLEEGDSICKACEERSVSLKLRKEYEKRIAELEDEAKMAKFASRRKQDKMQNAFAVFFVLFGAFVAPFLDLSHPWNISLPIGCVLGGGICITIAIVRVLKANEAKIKYEQLSKRLDDLKDEMSKIDN